MWKFSSVRSSLGLETNEFPLAILHSFGDEARSGESLACGSAKKAKPKAEGKAKAKSKATPVKRGNPDAPVPGALPRGGVNEDAPPAPRRREKLPRSSTGDKSDIPPEPLDADPPAEEAAEKDPEVEPKPDEQLKIGLKRTHQ